MPIGPVFSDFAEAAHFLLETVGEDVIHTIPRFFTNTAASKRSLRDNRSTASCSSPNASRGTRLSLTA